MSTPNAWAKRVGEADAPIGGNGERRMPPGPPTTRCVARPAPGHRRPF